MNRCGRGHGGEAGEEEEEGRGTGRRNNVMLIENIWNSAFDLFLCCCCCFLVVFPALFLWFNNVRKRDQS